MTQTKLTRNIAKFLLPQMLLWMAGVGIVFLTSIQPAHAAVQMLVFWDNGLGSVPTDWTAQSSYNGYMIRGNATAGGIGGSDADHTHTITNTTTGTSASPVSPQQKKGAVTVADDAHTHNITSSSTGTAGSVPYYRNLMLISYDYGVPSTLPQYAIVMFDTSTPGGFTRYSSQDGAFIRGAATAGGTGGSNALHQHTSVSIGTGSPNETQTQMVGGTVYYGCSTSHTHSVTGGTTDTDGDRRPPYVDVVLATVDSDATAIPTGMIAMFFNGALGAGWTALSESGGAFYQKYMSGASSYTAGLGSPTHTHGKIGGYTFNTWTAATGMASGTPAKAVAGTHSHALTTPTFSTANNAPAYMDVIVAKKQAVLSIVAPANVTLTAGNPSQTKDTTFAVGEKVVVTDGGAGWSLTVIMQSILTSGGNTIPNANVNLRKDGLVGSGSYTIWSGDYTNVSETNATESLDVSRTVGTRSSGTGGDLTEVRPSIQLNIPGIQAAGDYTGTMRFTVV